MRDANFSGANMGDYARVYFSDFRRADFSHADVEGILIRCSDFTNAILRGANLRRATTYKDDGHNKPYSVVKLNGADISGADMTESYLRNVSMVGADLSGADLRAARIQDVSLQ